MAADLLPQKLFCMSTACAGLLLFAWWASLIIQVPPETVLPCCRLDYFSVSAAAGNRAAPSPFACCPKSSAVALNWCSGLPLLAAEGLPCLYAGHYRIKCCIACLQLLPGLHNQACSAREHC